MHGGAQGGLRLLADEQLEVTRAADAAELDELRARLAQACKLREHVGDVTSKATTRYFKEELELLRRQLDNAEAQRAAADEGRETLRLELEQALQALRARLERSCNWIPEKAGRGVGEAVAAASRPRRRRRRRRGGAAGGGAPVRAQGGGVARRRARERGGRVAARGEVDCGGRWSRCRR